MIINIKNFGPIDKCEIDVKPLTVFVGANGTGKTWTATLIASLFSPYMWNYYFTAYSKEALSERYSIIEDAIEQLLVDGNTKINLEHFFKVSGSEYISNIARLLPEYFPSILGSQRILFKNLNLTAEFDIEKYVPYIIRSSVEKKTGEGKDGDAILELYTQKDDPNLYVFTSSSRKLQEKMPINLIRQKLSSFIFMVFHQAFYGNTHFFPAERTGMQQIMSEIHTVDEASTLKDTPSNKNRNARNMSVLLIDLITTTSEACDSEEQIRRQKLAEKTPTVRKYIELSRILENDILGGAVELNETGDKSIEILFNHNGVDSSFDISPVSSSIKDLISLVLYLRYVAQENDLIIMDEPEMNLHPEAQIKIMEFLSMIVNCGLNIITTTHSPYLVDHISNLTKAYELKKNGKNNLEAKFKLKNDLCFIDPDKVSVYLFDDKSAKNIFDGDLVDWDTFGNVSEYVSNLYFDL